MALLAEEKCFRCGDPAAFGVRMLEANKVFKPVCEACRLFIVRRVEQVALRISRGNPNASEVVRRAIEKLEFKDIRPFIILPPPSNIRR